MVLLTIGQCEILPRSETGMGTNGAIASSNKVLWLGGSAFIQNPTNIKAGQYASAEIEVELENDASSWKAKDGRSGSMIVLRVRPTKLLSAKGGK